MRRIASIQRPRMRREVLIFPASFSRSPRLCVLVVRSIPARSQNDIIFTAASVGSSQSFVRIILIVKTQWERLELWLSFVAAKCKFSLPNSNTRTASSAVLTQISFKPIKCYKIDFINSTDILGLFSRVLYQLFRIHGILEFCFSPPLILRLIYNSTPF